MTSEATCPNFLVIGAQKAGSTWIYRVLERHPEVFVPRLKEPEFFSYVERLDSEWGDYLRLFDSAGAAVARGEASPSYLWASPKDWERFPRPRGFNPDIPRAVRERLGAGLRLVVSLRDPVQRAISGYLHHFRKGRIRPGTPIMEAGRSFGILHMGLYYEHLLAWFDQFPQTSFHIAIFEESVRSPREYYASLFAFLGVEPGCAIAREEKPFNQGRSKVAQRQDGLYMQPDDGPAFRLASAADLRELADFYRSDVAGLERLLGRNLANWTLEPGADAADITR